MSSTRVRGGFSRPTLQQEGVDRGRQLLKDGDEEGAARVFQSVVSAASDKYEEKAVALYYLAVCCERRSQFKEAVRLLDDALSLDPTLVGAKLLKASCLAQLNDLDRSADQYECALMVREPTDTDRKSVATTFLHNRPPKSRFAAARQKGERVVLVRRAVRRPPPPPPVPRTEPVEQGPKAAESEGIGAAEPFEATVGSSTEALPDSADYYYQLGYEARRGGNFEKAVEWFTCAVEKDNEHVKSWFDRGFCYHQLDRYTEAIDDYEEAIRLNPTNEYAYYNVGISYDALEMFDKAIAMFTKAIELDGSRADFYHNRGFTYRKMGKYITAIKDYSSALQLDPKHFKSFFNRAFCHDKLNHLMEAVADYNAALSIDGTNTNAYHNRGIAHDKLQQYEEALADFTAALRCNSCASYALNARGLVEDQLGRYEEAVCDFTRAIELAPENGHYIFNRGFAYRNMNRMEEAVSDYTKALELLPEAFYIYSNRAFALRKLSRFEEAVKDYTILLDNSPGEVYKTLSNRAYCYALLGRFEEAVTDYTTLIKLDPSNPHVLYNRGVSYQKKKMHTAAVEDFSRVIEISRGSAHCCNAYFSRGASLVSLGMKTEAISDLLCSIELDFALHGVADKEEKEKRKLELPAWKMIQQLKSEK